MRIRGILAVLAASMVVSVARAEVERTMRRFAEQVMPKL